MSIEVKSLDSENGPLVGIALAAVAKADEVENAVIKIGEEQIPVPLRFYKGNLNTVRSELHSIVDELVDTLLG